VLGKRPQYLRYSERSWTRVRSKKMPNPIEEKNLLKEGGRGVYLDPVAYGRCKIKKIEGWVADLNDSKRKKRDTMESYVFLL